MQSGKKSKKLMLCIETLMIVVGTGLIASAIKFVYDPSKMVTGGFSGIAIIQSL